MLPNSKIVTEKSPVYFQPNVEAKSRHHNVTHTYHGRKFSDHKLQPSISSGKYLYYIIEPYVLKNNMVNVFFLLICPDLAVLNREAGLTNKKRGCCRSAVDKRVGSRLISP